MKAYKFKIPSGTLLACVLEECPKKFPSADIRSLYLYPTDGADFECTVCEGSDTLTRANLEVSAVLSYLFGAMRGIPECALTVRYNGRMLELPKLCTPPSFVDVVLPKCKHIFTKRTTFEDGTSDVLATVVGDDVTRIVEYPCGGTYPEPRLRRLRIVSGITDAVRAVAYSGESDGIRAVSTDKHETADSVAPLAHLLLGSRSSLDVSTQTGTYTFLRDGEYTIFRCPVEHISE